jgi:hypothetical protein
VRNTFTSVVKDVPSALGMRRGLALLGTCTVNWVSLPDVTTAEMPVSEL